MKAGADSQRRSLTLTSHTGGQTCLLSPLPVPALADLHFLGSFPASEEAQSSETSIQLCEGNSPPGRTLFSFLKGL